MLEGYVTALITPMRDGEVDEEAFRAFVEWQIAEGVSGLLPCGTTGESPTLSHDEHRRVTEICIDVAKGRVPVLAGTGSNSTAEAIELTRHAKMAGADAALLVMPYYNKPSQEGMYQHFKAIQDAVALPQYIYNIPGRSVVNMSVETMARLAQLPNIVGVKDATSDIARISTTRLILGSDFCQLSGEDPTAISVLAHGGHGCISVTANIAPALCAELQSLWSQGDAAGALAIQDKLIPVHIALFLETSPAPVKYALSLVDKCTDEVRLPLVTLKDETKEKVTVAIQSAGLLH